MSQTAYILAGITYYIVSVIAIVIVLNLINKREKKKYQSEIIALERDKNLIISSSILSELNKVEALVNNEKMQETFEDWQKRFKEIKDVEVPKLTDALIEIEDCFNEKQYTSLNDKIAKAELEIFYVKTKANFLLDEIKEITLSEERNRETITKLKSKYREIITKYNKNKKNLPSSFSEKVILGGCHSNFGMYGKQSGDGKCLISNVDQIRETMFLIYKYISE